MLASDKHVVTFEAPQPPLPHEKELLRAAAKLVYLDYSVERMDGLNMLCDGVTHFRYFAGSTRADRLLREVAREFDPSLT